MRELGRCRGVLEAPFRAYRAAEAQPCGRDPRNGVRSARPACRRRSVCGARTRAAGISNTPNADLRDRVQPGIASGTTLGGTGLSNPGQGAGRDRGFPAAWHAGRGRLVRHRRAAVGVQSRRGPLVRHDVRDGGRRRRVMAMFCCGQNNVEIRQNAHFVALEGTATYSSPVSAALFVPDADVLADPIDAMMPRIRPGFVLLQTGMGFGVIAGAAAQMRRMTTSATRTPTAICRPARTSFFEDEGAALDERMADLADTPGSGRDYLRAVLELRLAVSELTLAATQAGVHAWRRARLPRELGHRAAPARGQFRGPHHAVHPPSPSGDRGPLVLT